MAFQLWLDAAMRIETGLQAIPANSCPEWDSASLKRPVGCVGQAFCGRKRQSYVLSTSERALAASGLLSLYPASLRPGEILDSTNHGDFQLRQ